MTTALIIWAIVSAALTVFFLVVRVNKAPIFGLLSKTLASMAFVAMAGVGVYLAGDKLASGAQLIVVGLAFGMVGDILLDLKRAHSEFEDLYTTAGMTAFTADHAFVIAATYLIATPLIPNLWLPSLISAAIAAAAAPLVMFVSIKMMKAKFGKHFAFSAFYATYLIFFTVLSVWFAVLNPTFILLCTAMILFLVSDLVLSTMYFVEGKKEDKFLVVVNHVAYYASQILVAAWVFTLV
ncbi:MAG: lysoplasmalogenase family protein [Clostridia bacterium]|nr:lysoplasmalogenase family protein [Clostridia bacterium]